MNLQKSRKKLPPTAEVNAIDAIDWEGNLVPHNWFQWLKFDAGQTDFIACVILAEIVYWYRSGTPKDKASAKRYRKFDGELLQKSYAELAVKFCITKRQATDAICRLENAGLIKRVFQHKTVKGQRLSNVLYIRIFPDVIAEITCELPPPGVEGSHARRGDSHLTPESETIPTLGVTGAAPEGDTYTKISSESTDKEEPPKSSASGGLHSHFSSSAPEEQAGDDAPPAPPEDETPTPTSSIPVTQSPEFPKTDGNADYLQALHLYDAQAATLLLEAFPREEWNNDNARPFLRVRRNGALSDKDIKLFARFFRDTHFEEPAARPRNVKELLNDIPGVRAAVRHWVIEVYLGSAKDDLKGVSVGDFAFTSSNFNRAKTWLDSVSADAFWIPDGIHWAVRFHQAVTGLYPPWTPEEHTAIFEELADDPLIPTLEEWDSVDMERVLEITRDEIRVLNAVRVAERQAVVNDLQSLL